MIPCSNEIECKPNSIVIKGKEFKIDAVLQNKKQEEVYDAVEDFVVKNAENGFNSTLFAYGQTGSGKTYTILGENSNASNSNVTNSNFTNNISTSNSNSDGIVLRTLKYLHSKHKNIKISFIEIYNEEINDLSAMRCNLNCYCENSNSNNSSVKVEGLNIFNSQSFADSFEFFTHCFNNRKTSATQCNERSSRSHAIFTIYLEQGNYLNNNSNNLTIYKESKLTFVDLAGSEKLRENENVTNIFKETTIINKSLMNLGIIVNALNSNINSNSQITNISRTHIPYRDSKLTYLLKDSLGGNSKLCIIANVNLSCVNDSQNTLQFLQRIKHITNNPTINYSTDRNTKDVVDFLEKENLQLKETINNLEKSSGIYSYNALYRFKKLKEETIESIGKIGEIKSLIRSINNLYYDRPSEFEEIKKKRETFVEETRKILREETENIFRRM